MFLPPFGLDVIENLLEITVLYSVFSVIHNIGFATVQTAHLAMIPEMSSSDDTRASLTLLRNAMTALANVLAYLAAFVAFAMVRQCIIYCLFTLHY